MKVHLHRCPGSKSSRSPRRFLKVGYFGLTYLIQIAYNNVHITKSYLFSLLDILNTFEQDVDCQWYCENVLRAFWWSSEEGKAWTGERVDPAGRSCKSHPVSRQWERCENIIICIIIIFWFFISFHKYHPIQKATHSRYFQIKIAQCRRYNFYFNFLCSWKGGGIFRNWDEMHWAHSHELQGSVMLNYYYIKLLLYYNTEGLRLHKAQFWMKMNCVFLSNFHRWRTKWQSCKWNMIRPLSLAFLKTGDTLVMCFYQTGIVMLWFLQIHLNIS